MVRRSDKAPSEMPTITHTEDLLKSWLRQRPDLQLNHFLNAIAIMRVARILEHSFDVMCRKEHRISGADMRVLFALRRAGPPYVRRPTDLFRALLVTSGAMTKQVDRLRAKGLVKRAPHPEHRAGILIRLTEKGKRAADAATDALANESLLSLASVNISKSDRYAGEKYILSLLHGIEMATKFGAELPKKMAK